MGHDRGGAGATGRLRIGLVLQGGARWVGGAQYGKNLYHALSSLPEDERAAFTVVPLAQGPVEEALYDDVPGAFHRALAQGPPPAPGAAGRPARRLARLWPFARGPAGDPGPGGPPPVDFLYPHLPAAGGPPGVAYAGWIYDFQHKHLPGLFPAREVARRDEAFARLAAVAPRVVLSSRDAARDFARWFPGHARKARVLSFCTASQPSWYRGDPDPVRRAYGLPGRFFLLCNQFWQHKNHRAAFEALALLRHRGCRPVLACTGPLLDPRRPDYADSVRRQVAELCPGDQVRLLGLVPRADQVQLMRQAVAVVQPSLFEGWSTVVEDARALGKVLALSDLAVHKEQDPPRAAYFAPDDHARLAALLEGWWHRLPGGPDPAAEAAAKRDNALRLRAFARRFLGIARECVACASSPARP